MKKSLHTQLRITVALHTLLASMVTVLVFSICISSFAYERYKNDAEDPDSNCSLCHGDFTDGTSTKGSVFPGGGGGDKHTMHRSSSYMSTDCDLCHRSDDSRNPYLSSSDGTVNTAGLGCNGCHVAVGLRAHHAANGVALCAVCHTNDAAPVAESVNPPYYGSVDTLANTACNDVAAANVNENWTVGDFLGLDNDGDNLYDMADFDCGPYRIAEILVEGNDIKISWETAGGRRDVLQAASSLTAGFSDVGFTNTIPGVGVVTTNVVESGGATSSNRFYRIRFVP
jgi:hypothetical protein